MGNTSDPSSEAESSAWTTRLPVEMTRAYGVAELHTVWFLPNNWPGTGPTVRLQIPEGKISSFSLAPNGVLEMQIHPQIQKMKFALRKACSLAAEQRAALIISTDTNEQAEHAAKKATRLLPRHERAAMERMEEPAARSRSDLN